MRRYFSIIFAASLSVILLGQEASRLQDVVIIDETAAQTLYVSPITITMIPVGWTDLPSPVYTAEESKTLCQPIADFWNGVSKGKFTMLCAGEATHQFPTAFIPGDCIGDWTGAVTAAGGANDRLPVYLLNIGGCNFAGGRAILGHPGTWLYGNLSDAAHEIGHNLGLLHTGQIISCQGGLFDPDPAGGCTFSGYAFGFDVMGTGVGLDAPHAAALGIPPTAVLLSLPVPSVQTLSIALAPVVFQRPNSIISYWVEYQPDGIIYVTYTGWPFAYTDVILAAKLGIGESWQDQYAGVTITRVDTKSISISAVVPLITPTLTPTPQPSPTLTPTPSRVIPPRQRTRLPISVHRDAL